MRAPAVATRRIASAFRVSEAFSSMTPQPRSAARAWAAVVLPQPGLPDRMTARFLGALPEPQDLAHVSNDWRAFLFPTTSSNERGLYFSVHSTLILSPNCPLDRRHFRGGGCRSAMGPMGTLASSGGLRKV